MAPKAASAFESGQTSLLACSGSAKSATPPRPISSVSVRPERSKGGVAQGLGVPTARSAEGRAYLWARRAHRRPEEGPLVAYMITAAKLVPDEDDPLKLITEALANDPVVAMAKIDYLRSRGEPRGWWSFAKEIHARHPDDEHLARADAEADIDRAARWAEANDRRPLNGELRVQVTEATAVLQQLRSKFGGPKQPGMTIRPH